MASLAELLREVRRLRRAADTRRDLLTVAQACRWLQIGEVEGALWLRTRGLVIEVCGRPRVLRSALLEAAARDAGTRKMPWERRAQRPAASWAAVARKVGS